MGKRRIIAADCETDKFLYGRIPEPFIWGVYDGDDYKLFFTTKEFVEYIKEQDAIVYAHNGGKFDWIYIIPFIEDTTDVRIIGGRIAEIKLGRALLRDSYSIIPEPLAKIDKDEIDYDLMEKDVRHKYMDSHIIPYLKKDVYVLFVLVTHFRQEAGNALTIASNAMNSAKKLGINPGRTNYRFDEKMRRFYFGGRTECFLPGTFHNLSVYDIRSSYPFAMSQDHATGDRRVEHSSLKNIAKEDIGRCFIKLQCYSDGAFPLKVDETLTFPEGFNSFYVTGWEFLTAVKHDLIKNVNIQSVIEFESKINFAPYVDKWFKYKEQYRPRRTLEEKAKYIIGKILLNSLYGKLAMNPMKYWDYKICDIGEEIDVMEGWQKYALFQGKEIHRRSVAWNMKFKYGVEWQKKPLFYNVATGASITGFARANLLDAMCLAGRERVIYCDTDSIALLGQETPPLDLSPNLGAWDCEFLANTGHFAGKKLYAMKGVEPGKDETKFKIASKGSKLNFDEMARVMKGESVTWKNEAPSYSIVTGADFNDENIDVEKLFVKRDISMTV